MRSGCSRLSNTIYTRSHFGRNMYAYRLPVPTLADTAFSTRNFTAPGRPQCRLASAALSRSTANQCAAASCPYSKIGAELAAGWSTKSPIGTALAASVVSTGSKKWSSAKAATITIVVVVAVAYTGHDAAKGRLFQPRTCNRTRRRLVDDDMHSNMSCLFPRLVQPYGGNRPIGPRMLHPSRLSE